MSKKIIAIFGGAFNPPINSHVFLAKQIIEKLNNIEKLIFVPVSTKYKKQNLIEDEHRLNMLQIICNKEEKMEVSDVEIKSEKQLYTIQTLNYFKTLYKKNQIYFIMGTDNLKELDTWKDPKEILKKYKIIVLEREDDDLEKIIASNELLRKYKKNIIKIEGINRIYLSSTMIRDKIKRGESIKEFIDEDVLEYIKNNGLYF
ncbi:MAG: nicotinate (nicotinamide) nucleotide adenylyltransferase [Clostridia bacterium]|nr:nicotinate (nicotinamide) nucleotide adenylyltransferase [Clostridia bacterium]